MRIAWLGHASFRIEAGKTIYIDPYKLDQEEKADLILVTHSHFDHCSADDIRALSKDGTEVIGPADCQCITRRIMPGQELEAHGIRIQAVPAYNTNKEFHQRFHNWVGYIITVEGKRIYHTGDSDLIPEMRDIKNIDTLLIPVGGTYTMDAADAAKAADIIRPRVAVPMHYGKIIGSKSDAERFRELYKGKVEFLSN
jgi:L-ascorbate metabolism protein UlaG (beta-lactamase superfamily)